MQFIFTCLFPRGKPLLISTNFMSSSRSSSLRQQATSLSGAHLLPTSKKVQALHLSPLRTSFLCNVTILVHHPLEINMGIVPQNGHSPEWRSKPASPPPKLSSAHGHPQWNPVSQLFSTFSASLPRSSSKNSLSSRFEPPGKGMAFSPIPSQDYIQKARYRQSFA